MTKKRKPQAGNRKSKTRAEQRNARKKNLRRLRMSREKDVEALDKQVGDLEKKIQTTVTDFQEQARTVSATVKEILTDAGVWDEVFVLETERNQAKDKAQALINELQQELVDKRKIKDFLVARDNIDKRKGDKAPDLDAEPEAPKLVEDEDKVVDIPTEKSDTKSDADDAPEL